MKNWKNWKEVIIILIVTALTIGIIIHFHHWHLETNQVSNDQVVVSVNNMDPGENQELVSVTKDKSSIIISFIKETITIDGKIQKMKKKGNFLLCNLGTLQVSYDKSCSNDLVVSYDQEKKAVVISKNFKNTTIKFNGNKTKETDDLPIFTKKLDDGYYYLQF